MAMFYRYSYKTLVLGPSFPSWTHFYAPSEKDADKQFLHWYKKRTGKELDSVPKNIEKMRHPW